MNKDKTSQKIKFEEHKHIKKPLIDYLTVLVGRN